MKIGFYRWAETDEATKVRILRRSGADIAAIMEKARPIIADVKERGDAALIDCARNFDRADITNIKVSDEEFDHAARTLDPVIKKALDRCIGNVRKFHEEQMCRVEREWMVEVEPGVFAGEKVTPVSSVGLYVPGGKNQYPSAVYMLGVPAVIAGVPKIAMTTPPRPDGTIGNALLYAAQLSGVKNVYKAGGAQAIAALAYGTQTIPAVKKVLGPGSPWVAAAINALPEPQRGWLITNMEHYSGVILTRSLQESIDFCNEYATEHLLVKVEDAEAILPHLINAGEILIGESTPSSLGNFGIGVNHVLPTNGGAHSYSCTSVWDFLKRTSLARVTPAGLNALKDDICTIADYEGFPAHANVLRQRNLKNN